MREHRVVWKKLGSFRFKAIGVSRKAWSDEKAAQQRPPPREGGIKPRRAPTLWVLERADQIRSALLKQEIKGKCNAASTCTWA